MKEQLTFNDPDLSDDENFSEAFYYCRQVDHPVIVMINNECWKLYPSGSAKSGRLKTAK